MTNTQDPFSEDDQRLSAEGFKRNGELTWNHPAGASIWYDRGLASDRSWVLFPGGIQRPRRYRTIENLIRAFQALVIS